VYYIHGVLEVCGSTRTRGYESGTGRCLTGRVGYGYTKNTIFDDFGAEQNKWIKQNQSVN